MAQKNYQTAKTLLAEVTERLEVTNKTLSKVTLQLQEAVTENDSLIAETKSLREQLLPPPAPTVKGTISGDAVRTIYAKLFSKQASKIFISDRKFDITTIAEIRRFVKWSVIDEIKYVAEKFDCDDFAMALAGQFSMYPEWSAYPVTFMWASFIIGGHAFNTVIAWPSEEDRTPTAYFIEPQTDAPMNPALIKSLNLTVLPMSKAKD